MKIFNRPATASSKRGIASLYIVIFATVLFGVVTLSFSRVMLSEETQSSNDDLSQSALDSAIAGVEDAKVIIANYYKCLSQPGANSTTCPTIFVDLDAVNDNEDSSPCTEPETLLQSSTANTSDQAYTCVLISDITPDYRGQLTTESSTRVVPIAINDDGLPGGTNLGQVAKIKFSWYSEDNLNGGTFWQSPNALFYPLVQDAAPAIQLTLIRTGNTITLDDFRALNSDGSLKNQSTGRALNSAVALLPSTAGTNPATTASAPYGKIISATEIVDADNAAKQNNPFLVRCYSGTEFACVATLTVDGLLQDGDNAFLVVTMPYRNPISDFMIQLYDRNDNPIDFKGVQLRVDSTGRTNQLFRRVETRLERTDLFFPYPGYALELNGNSEGLYKNRWFTANCWHTYGTCAQNGIL